MTDGIIREKARAEGSLTPTEANMIRDSIPLWTRRAHRTHPIVPERIVPAIKGLYAATGLKRPHIAIAASPLSLAFAYGGALACARRRDAVLAALDGMTMVISRGEGARQATNGKERADQAVPDDVRKVFERAEKKTAIASGKPQKLSGESPLFSEVRENLELRFARGMNNR